MTHNSEERKNFKKYIRKAQIVWTQFGNQIKLLRLKSDINSLKQIFLT